MSIRATEFTCWVLIVLVSVPSLAQHESLQLKGIVVDANQVPIPGAAVTVAKTRQGAITDANGKYTLEFNRAGTYQIEVSSLGFKSQRSKVTINSDQTTAANFQLIEEVSELNEVIIRGKSLEQEKREEPIRVDLLILKSPKCSH
ncbi:MAG: carboxypeptidase-like regulatory domain-containing protein [Cyclobacteriaceae bacterium]